MKVIFPCSYYLPETAASLYITDNIVHACAENGLEVDLYTPTPTRSVPARAQWERTASQDLEEIFKRNYGPLEKVCGYRSTIKILFCQFI